MQVFTAQISGPLRFLLFSIFLLRICSSASELLAEDFLSVPTLSGRVVDQTATLSRDQAQTITQYLEQLEQEKGSQLVVLIVSSTKPETIEQYSMRVVENWKLGRAEVDDGVLLLVAKQDRKLRIEVGYGLEGVLTDFLSKSIIANIITPYFKRGQFFEGIQAGVEAIANSIRGEPLAAPPFGSGRIRAPATDTFTGWIFFGFFIGGYALLYWLQAKGVGGVLSALLVATFGGVLVAIFVSAVLGVILFFILLLSFLRTTYGGGSGGGWSSGGGGFGGGGFSGGGGSFGGGGASGGW